MRVLHLLKTAVGATWALRQVIELVAHGVDVDVALPPGPLVERYRAAGATVHLADLGLAPRHPGRSVEAIRALRRLVAEVRPDLIHSHFVNTTLTMRLALGRDHPIPRAFQVPGPLHLERTAFRAAELATAGTADYWIGSCAWTCARYRQSGVSAERVFLSIYGVDLREVRAGRPAAVVRAELGLAPAAKVVGLVAYMYAPKRYLGQRTGIKGHEDLIDAIARHGSAALRLTAEEAMIHVARAYERMRATVCADHRAVIAGTGVRTVGSLAIEAAAADSFEVVPLTPLVDDGAEPTSVHGPRIPAPTTAPRAVTAP